MTDRGPLPPPPRRASTTSRGAVYDIRRASGLRLRERVAVQTRRDALVHELAAIDEQLLAMSEQRQHVVEQLRAIREQLYPPIPWSHGRRPPDLDIAPLPPALEGAQALVGRALRAACRQILRRHGPTSLRDLHGLIHRYGYLVGSKRPVAALSDAMRHEVHAGRARRVERGVYELLTGPGSRRTRSGAWLRVPSAELIASYRAGGSTPLDQDLDEDPGTWRFAPAPDPDPGCAT